MIVKAFIRRLRMTLGASSFEDFQGTVSGKFGRPIRRLNWMLSAACWGQWAILLAVIVVIRTLGD
jgi:hypothetical protein